MTTPLHTYPRTQVSIVLLDGAVVYGDGCTRTVLGLPADEAEVDILVSVLVAAVALLLIALILQFCMQRRREARKVRTPHHTTQHLACKS
jgi:hypothetical protein